MTHEIVCIHIAMSPLVRTSMDIKYETNPNGTPAELNHEARLCAVCAGRFIAFMQQIAYGTGEKGDIST